MKNNKVLITLFLLGLLLPTVMHAAEDWRTVYEKSGFKRTSSYDETVDYCQRLAKTSGWVKYTSFGKSAQGRNLPLLIVDKKGHFTPRAVRKSGNAVLFVQAGIHSGEIDGKDAGLLLIRDLVIRHKLPNLLEGTTLLFVPIFNVDGHERSGPYNRINQNGPEEMGWRVTAQNLNLNRDYLKADSPEMQAWLGMFDAWLPDLLLDIHVTDGADYQYTVTYGLETSKNVVKPLRNFSQDVLEPFIKQRMLGDGFPMIPYIMFRDWNDVQSGLVSWAATPRYSTGYGMAQNRIFFLVENHMLKPYKTRVDATYHLLIHFLEFSDTYSEKIQEVNAESDSVTARALPGGEFYPNMKTSMEDSSFIDFLGVAYDRVPSDISGTDWVIYHPDRPRTYHMPYFNKIYPEDSVRVPYAYLIPKEWHFAIDKLKLHGVKISRLKNDTTLVVKSYRFNNPEWNEKPYEGHHQATYDVKEITETRFYPGGTAVILMNQRTNRIVLYALEPKSPDSFIAWGYWDTVFEQKEYAEGYVLEKLARKMLDENPQLRQEFDARLARDSSFAANPRARLYFFYKRSPYWDKNKDVYPVGKLMEPHRLPLRDEVN